MKRAAWATPLEVQKTWQAWMTTILRGRGTQCSLEPLGLDENPGPQRCMRIPDELTCFTTFREPSIQPLEQSVSEVCPFGIPRTSILNAVGSGNISSQPGWSFQIVWGATTVAATQWTRDSTAQTGCYCKLGER